MPARARVLTAELGWVQRVQLETQACVHTRYCWVGMDGLLRKRANTLQCVRACVCVLGVPSHATTLASMDALS